MVGTLHGGPAFFQRAWLMVTDQWPVLLGYDAGYPPPVDALLRVLAWAAVGAAAVAVIHAARRAVAAEAVVHRVLLLLLTINLVVAVAALPQVPGNPRYLVFLMAPLAVFLADLLAGGRRRVAVLIILVGLGAAGSLAQAPAAFRSDADWRGFVSRLESLGVRWCYTDFHQATRISFLSEERIVCSAKLGPITTEYFFEYRDRVESAPEAALIAVNPTAAEKLERRLERLGVSYERRDLLKPVLLRLSRKVDPEELFPDRAFPRR